METPDATERNIKTTDILRETTRPNIMCNLTNAPTHCTSYATLPSTRFTTSFQIILLETTRADKLTYLSVQY